MQMCGASLAMLARLPVEELVKLVPVLELMLQDKFGICLIMLRVHDKL